MDENRAAGTESNAAEIVRLCEGYSIVSEYASFIVLENDAEYKRWQIERRNATRVQRDRAAQLALRQQLDQLRQQAAAQLGPNVASTATSATPTAAATPAPAPSTSPVRQAAASAPMPAAPPSPRSRDIHLPTSSRGGGGAVDPLTVLLGVGLAGLGYAGRRRRAGRKQEDTAGTANK